MKSPFIQSSHPLPCPMPRGGRSPFWSGARRLMPSAQVLASTAATVQQSESILIQTRQDNSRLMDVFPRDRGRVFAVRAWKHSLTRGRVTSRGNLPFREPVDAFRHTLGRSQGTPPAPSPGSLPREPGSPPTPSLYLSTPVPI